MSARGTTILAVRRAGQVAVIGDGQVTWNEATIIKSSATKVRRLATGQVVCGFAGASADAITLFELLEEKLEAHANRLERAAVEVAKLWRTDRALGRLDALILAADRERTLILSGNGDVLEPSGGAASIGSGSVYALSAARALLDHTSLSAEAIARAALSVAAELCVYTNAEATLELLEREG